MVASDGEEELADSPISHHEGGGASEAPPADEEASGEQQAKMEQAYAQMQRKLRITKIGEQVKHKLMVLSGKGGVGKTTVATGLSLALARRGLKVGLMDIDITGPNVPKMLGMTGHDLRVEESQIHPAIGPHGVKVISMAFLLEDPDAAIIWRGPIKLGAIQQIIGDVAWGELDAMVIDFPPGTSDEPLTVAQSLPNIDGVVVITTPQEVSLMDSRKSINFAETVKVPVLGIIENMSGYKLKGTAEPNSKVSVMGPNGVPIEVESDDEGAWSVTLDLFKRGGGEEAAEELGVPFLGRLPFDPGIVRGGDDGVHRIIADPEGESALAFDEIVNRLLEGMSASTSSSLKII